VSEVGSTKTGNSAVDAFRDDNGSSRAACANGDTKKGAIRRGESGSPLELLGSRALSPGARGVTQPGPTSPAAWQLHGARFDGPALR
jgi:hypothetical protein